MAFRLIGASSDVLASSERIRRGADPVPFVTSNDIAELEHMANDANPSPTSAYSRERGGNSAPPVAVEAPKVEAQPAPEPVRAEPAKETAAPEVEAPEDNRQVPLAELLSERSKAKDYRSKLEEADKRIRDYEAFVANIVQQNNRQQQTQEQQQPQYDPTLQPQEWAEQQRQEVYRTIRNQIANQSQALAVEKHGHELVNKAIEWAHQNGVAQRFFWQSPEPYSEMLTAYKRATAFQEIGDPDAWRASERKKIEAEVLAKLKAGNPPPQQNFPGSLATATSAGPQGATRTEQDMAARIYDTNRNRRAY